MRDLNSDEILMVNGGFAPALAVPIVIGAATGGVAGAVQSDGNIGSTIFGAAAGAAAGFFGTVAAVTTGVVRGIYGGYAVMVGSVASWNDS
jgi:lactobin A/cerein 7B family class IIb bacteriocin